MAGTGKDYFGIALNAQDRINRSKESSQRFKEYEEYLKLSPEERRKVDWKKAEEEEKAYREAEAEKKRLAKEEAEKLRFAPLTEEQRLAGIEARRILKLKEEGKWNKPSKEPKPEKIVEIIEALYGLKEEKVIDITDKIIVGKKVNNDLAGEDPVPNKKKNVYVKAIVDGVEVETIFLEKKKIIF